MIELERCVAIPIQEIFMAHTNSSGRPPGPISPQQMAGAIRLGDVQWSSDGRLLVWHENRGGHGVLVGFNPDSDDAPFDLSPPELSVRGRVGYGGGEFCAGTDAIFFAAEAGRIYRMPLAGAGLSLVVPGTPFQIKVWQALLDIPPGHLVTYNYLAKKLGYEKTAARAVGQAVGANPVSWLIPCHRVIREDGGLGGYRWGLQVKRALLALEGAGCARRHSRASGRLVRKTA
ncbi:MAG: methylated-DNA--[protein]-cysteine S-methyltransferase, partial [Oscillochloris sp.]|nr:methylated-DNA--[protein]-cysteine S-methyltransferase [Oscillochloris sp.]